MKIVFCVISFTLFMMINNLRAQTFKEISPDFESGYSGTAIWADYDNDGDLDVLVTGLSSYDSPQYRLTKLYRNDAGTFVDVHANFVQVCFSTAAWGDYNGDNFLDLAIAGQDANSNNILYLYKNLGDGTFEKIETDFRGIKDGNLVWGDYDNDGDLDLAAYDSYNKIIYNNKGGERFEKFVYKLRYGKNSKFSFVDFDNDGDLDISAGTRLYRNIGNNQFVDLGIDLSEKKTWQQWGPISWGDYDNDGDLDLISERTLYKNEHGEFRKDRVLNLSGGYAVQNTVFADMDNDGDLDLLVAGTFNGSSKSEAYYFKNSGDSGFVRVETPFKPLGYGDIAVGDYNNDGKLDVLLTGVDAVERKTYTLIYENEGINSNSKPESPSMLKATIQNGAVLLEWDPGNDLETPSSSLSYNLSIFSYEDSLLVKSPQSDTLSGWRYTPFCGNVGLGTQWPFKPLKSGKFKWAVQTVDQGFTGSAFSEQQTFTIPNLPPVAVHLLKPAQNDTLENYEIHFEWTKSVDYFSDTLSYSLHIFSFDQDTLIGPMLDTSYDFSAKGWIKPGVKYDWMVFANDDQYSVASIDTFSFLKRKIEFGMLVDSLYFKITNTRDSVEFVNTEGKLIAKVIWNDGEVSAENDTFRLGIFSHPIVPPAKGAKNYGLQLPILFEPVQSEEITFSYDKVKLRIYADTTEFTLSDIEPSFKFYEIHEDESLFKPVFKWYYRINYEKNYIEYSISHISPGAIYMLAAENLLIGEIVSTGNPILVEQDMLVPANKSVSLGPGVHYYNYDQYYNLKVLGILQCAGTEKNPVRLDNINISLTGRKRDKVISNNQLKGDFNWIEAKNIGVNWANLKINNGQFNNISITDYSKVSLENIRTNYVNITNSIANISHAVFDSSGFFTSWYSIVNISNSIFKYYDYESEHRHSYIHLFGNEIYANAFLEPIQPMYCMVIYDSNKVIYAGLPNENSNAVGISVFDHNYAIIKNNIIKGFRSGVEIGYHNKAVIFNNTIVETQNGIEVYGTPDTSSFYNNIFYNFDYNAIDLNYSTYSSGDTNVAFINNNLWYTNSSYFTQYIDNDKKNSLIIGNSYSIHANPSFKELENFTLNSNSPAIDHGARIIPAFSFTFQVLDSVFTVKDEIELRNYVGSRPDIGAREYGITSISSNREALPKKYELKQNYPNPFNPITYIRYSLPKSSRTKLEIFNILGQKVCTLVDKKQKAGRYLVKWNGHNSKNEKVGTGIYLLKMTSGEFSKCVKMILIK